MLGAINVTVPDTPPVRASLVIHGLPVTSENSGITMSGLIESPTLTIGQSEPTGSSSLAILTFTVISSPGACIILLIFTSPVIGLAPVQIGTGLPGPQSKTKLMCPASALYIPPPKKDTTMNNETSNVFLTEIFHP